MIGGPLTIGGGRTCGFRSLPIVFMVIGLIFCAFMMSMMMGMMGRRHRWRDEQFAGGKTSLDILDERYARGEINQSEYTEKRRTITQGR